MIQERNGLGIGRFGNPDLVYPIPVKSWIDFLQVRQEFLCQFLIAFGEIRMVCFQVISDVKNMIPAKVFRLEKFVAVPPAKGRGNQPVLGCCTSSTPRVRVGA